MVTKPICISRRLIGISLSALVIACQGSDLTLPADGMPSSLEVVSESGQRGTVGSELPDPLVVRVTDAAARPVSQVSLRFQTQVPGAQIQPSEIATNDTGYAEVQIHLGNTQGTQIFDVQVADALDLRATFAVIAVAAPPPDDGGNGGGDDAGNDDGDHGNGHGDNEDQGHDDDHGDGHGHDNDHGHDHDDDRGED
jgi:hypothetical protein